MTQLADSESDYVLVFDGVNGLRMAPRAMAAAFEDQDPGHLQVEPPPVTEAQAGRAPRTGRAVAVIGAVIALGVVGFTVGRIVRSPGPVVGRPARLAPPALVEPASGPILAAPRPPDPILPSSHAARRAASRTMAQVAHPSSPPRLAVHKPAPGPMPCMTGGWTDRLVCRDPALAAQDARLGAALKSAAQVGVPMVELQDGQFAWLAERNAAARRSRAEVSAAYRRRIEEVESLANEAPPY